MTFFAVLVARKPLRANETERAPAGAQTLLNFGIVVGSGRRAKAQVFARARVPLRKCAGIYPELLRNGMHSNGAVLRHYTKHIIL